MRDAYDRLVAVSRGLQQLYVLAALDEAQGSGARLHAACRLIGISARTIERWRGQPGGTTAGVVRSADLAMR